MSDKVVVPVLDKSSFKTIIPALAVRVESKQCAALVKLIRRQMFKVRGCKPVVEDPENPKNRLVLLAADVEDESLTSLAEEKRKVIQEMGLGVVKHNVPFDYENMTAEQVLRKILPQGMEIQTSFEAMGHVAHLNLRKECLPYKHLIGEVLLDKNKIIKTVVNKTGTISNQFRTFPLEIIAGDSNLDVEVKEHGVRFRFNVQDVYWNSRLQEEHHKLVDRFNKTDVIADACCGIGPFAIPAMKKHNCEVHANDLNPKSYESLVQNIKINKVDGKIKAYNMDAREFLRKILGGKEPTPVTQIVMNLPAIALEFLDCLNGAFDASIWLKSETYKQLPTVNCYCFSNAEDPTADVIARAEKALGGKLPESSNVKVREVRDVAPNKQMYCIHFIVPEQIAFNETEHQAKKARVEQ